MSKEDEYFAAFCHLIYKVGVTCDIVSRSEAQGIVIAAGSGNKEAAELCRAVSFAVGRVEKRPAKCACCQRMVSDPAVIVILFPANRAPGMSVGLALCERCGDQKGLVGRTQDCVKALFPGMMALPQPTHEGGRA
jgi:hypothetical protein